MKNQYKLKKKYPSLFKDWEEGMIVSQGDRNGLYANFSPLNSKYSDVQIQYQDIVNYPEFWEKIIDIKVGQYINRIWPSGKKTLGRACNFFDYKYNYENTNLNFTHFYALEDYECEGGVRKNDGYGAFMGDDYKYELATEVEINEYLESIKPLFTTEDGIELFDSEDMVYGVNSKQTQFTNETRICVSFSIGGEWKWFSSKEKRSEYIEENKHKYSKKDMISAITYSRGYSENILSDDCFYHWLISPYNTKK